MTKEKDSVYFHRNLTRQLALSDISLISGGFDPNKSLQKPGP